MTTLIVPDIHERWLAARRVVEQHLGKTADRAIFLGDYLDSFQHTHESAMNTIDLVKDLLTDNRCTLLLGNHDLHYLFDNYWLRCSGYHEVTRLQVERRFTIEELERLRDVPARTFAHCGGMLISHAGVHPSFLPKDGYSEAWLTTLTDRADVRIRQGDTAGPLLAVGRARGGYSGVGGPFWLDWPKEFVDDPRLPPQLVGHSEADVVRRKGRSLCLDARFSAVALLSEEGITLLSLGTAA